MRSRLLFSLIILFATLATQTHAAERYWTGGTDSLWNNTNNWSATSGGTSGVSVPGTSDTVYFNGYSVKDCYLTGNATVRGMYLDSGFVNTVYQGSYTLTVNTKGIHVKSGTFEGGSGNITINSGGLQLTGGIFTATSANLIVLGSVNNTATFNHNNGTMVLWVANTISGDSIVCHNLQVRFGTYNVSCPVIIENELEYANYGNDVAIINYSGSGQFNVKGDIYLNNNRQGGGGNATIYLIGDGNQEIRSSVPRFACFLPNIKIDKPSGTLKLVGEVAVGGTWHYEKGTIETDSSTITIWGANIITGKSHSIENLCIRAGYINIKTPFIVNSSLTYFNHGNDIVTVNVSDSGSIAVKGDIYLNNNRQGGGGNATIHLTGTGNQEIRSTVPRFNSLLPHIRINKPTGTLKFVGEVGLTGTWHYENGTIETDSSTITFWSSNIITGKSHEISNLCIRHSYVNIKTPLIIDKTLIYHNVGTDVIGINVSDSGSTAVKGDIYLNNNRQGGGGNATIYLIGDGNQEIRSSVPRFACALPSIKIDKPTGTLKFVGEVAVGGIWHYENGTIETDSSTITIWGANIITGKSHSIENLCIRQGNINIKTPFIVNSSLTYFNHGNDIVTVNVSDSGSIAVKGDIYLNNIQPGGAGNATIHLTGTGNQLIKSTVTQGRNLLPAITVNKPSGMLQMEGIISLSRGWTHVQGMVDAYTYNSTVYLSNQYNTVTGNAVFDNLWLQSADNLPFTVSDTIAVKDSLIMSGTNRITLNGNIINAHGNLINTNTAYNGGGTANIILMGDGEQQVVGLDSATVNAEGRGKLPNVTVNKLSGSVNWTGVVNIGGKLHWQQGYGIANEYSKVVLFETDSILGGNAVSEATLPAFYELKYITNHNRKLGSPTAIHQKLTLNGGSLNLNGNTLFVNTADKDVFESNAKIISTQESDKVSWRIGEDTGTYTIPFVTAALEDVKVEMQILTAGTGEAGYLEFGTYGTGSDNQPVPDINVNALTFLEEDSLKLVDRYWNITPVGYDTLPVSKLKLKWSAAEWEGNNDIAKDSLQIAVLENYCWITMAGIVDTVLNTIEADSFSKYGTMVLHEMSATPTCDIGNSCANAYLLTEADYNNTVFTMTDTVMWFKFVAGDSLFRLKFIDSGSGDTIYVNSIAMYESCSILMHDSTYQFSDSLYLQYLYSLSFGYYEVTSSNTYYLKISQPQGKISKFRFHHREPRPMPSCNPANTCNLICCGDFECLEIRINSPQEGGELTNFAMNDFSNYNNVPALGPSEYYYNPQIYSPTNGYAQTNYFENFCDPGGSGFGKNYPLPHDNPDYVSGQLNFDAVDIDMDGNYFALTHLPRALYFELNDDIAIDNCDYELSFWMYTGCVTNINVWLTNGKPCINENVYNNGALVQTNCLTEGYVFNPIYNLVFENLSTLITNNPSAVDKTEWKRFSATIPKNLGINYNDITHVVVYASSQTIQLDHHPVLIDDIELNKTCVTIDHEIVCNGSNQFEVTYEGNVECHTSSSWSWNFGSGAAPSSATGQGPHTVTYSQTGNTTITASLTVDGKTTAIDVELTRPTPPTIDKSVANCSLGNPVSYSIVSPEQGVGYYWGITGGSGYPLLAPSNGFVANWSGNNRQLTITGYDNKSCYSQSVFTATALGLSTNVTNVCGSTNGAIDLTVTGGTAAYSYSWSPGGQTTQDISNLTASTYYVTVTDAYNCSATTNTTILSSPAITLSGSTTNAQCAGVNNGAIDITVTGGTSPYGYAWSPSGATTQDITSLASGIYTVSVTDAYGCTKAESYSVGAINTILVTATVTYDFCDSIQDEGGIKVIPSGGTSPYTYLWSNGNTTDSPDGLVPGIYTVTITDANGCTASHTQDLNLYTHPNGLDLGPGSYNFSNVNWRFGNSLILRTGASVIFNNSNLRFDEFNSSSEPIKLIVERGARLVFNNTVATVLNYCEDIMWHGIEVWGNGASIQPTAVAIDNGYPTNVYPSTDYQGVFIMYNNSEVNNAYTGVFLGKDRLLSRTEFGGGVIRASDNSKFVNNQMGVIFTQYVKSNSVSLFKDCKFQTTSALAKPSIHPAAFVLIWQHPGAGFAKNTFENTHTTTQADQKGAGIWSFFSNPKVGSINSGLPGRFNIGNNRNTFTNLYYGVRMHGNFTLNTNQGRAAVLNNLFEECHNAIYAQAVRYAEIKQNTIEAGEPYTLNSVSRPSYGIYIDGCTGVEVQENTIEESAAPSIWNRGIYVTNSSGSTSREEVYKNTIDNVFISLNASLDNKSTQFICNSMTDAYYHLYSFSGRIEAEQGGCFLDFGLKPAGNTFTTCNTNLYGDPHLHAQNATGYIYWYNFFESNEIPNVNCVSNNIQLNDCRDVTNTCASKIGYFISNPPINAGVITVISGNGGITGINTALNNMRQGLLPAYSDLKTMLNGYTLTASQMKDSLVAQGNRLTDDILIQAIAKVEATTDDEFFSPAEIRDILVNNAPNTATVIEAAQQRAWSLGDYISPILAAQDSPATGRIDTMSLIALKQHEKGIIYNTFIQFAIEDSNDISIAQVIDSLRYDDDIASKTALIDMYTAADSITEATTVLNNITAYNNDLRSYKQLKEIELQLLDDGYTWLDTAQYDISDLWNITATETKASREAQAILSMLLDTVFIELIEDIEDMVYYRLGRFEEITDEKQIVEIESAKEILEIRVYPNPAKNELIVEFSTDDTLVYNIRMYDVLGKEKVNKKLDNKLNNKHVIDIDEIESGVIIYEIKNKHLIIKNGKVIKMMGIPLFLIITLLFSSFSLFGQKSFSTRLYFDDNSFDGTAISTFETDSGYIVFNALINDSINNGWSSFGIYQTDSIGELIKKTFYGVWGRRHFGGISGDFIRIDKYNYTSAHTVIIDSNTANYDVSFLRYNSLTDNIISNYIDLGKNEIGRTPIRTLDNGYAIIGTQSEFNAIDPGVGRILLVKTDSTGNYQWHKAYNSPTRAFGLGIVSAHDGGYLLSSAGFAAGKDVDTYIIKTDTAGNVEWTKNYGTVNFDGGGVIKMSSDSSYILKGAIDTFNLQTNSGQKLVPNYIMKIDVDGNMLWRYITNYGNWYHQLDMVREVAPGKGYIAVGQIYEEVFNGENIVGLILRFDDDGNLLWERRYALQANTPSSRNGFAGYSILRDIQPTKDNGFIVAGNLQYINPDVWLLKLDSLGCMGDYCGLTDPNCYYRPYPNCDDTLSVADISYEQKDQRVVVYPNPATDQIHFKAFSKYAAVKSITLYDVTGKATLHETNSNKVIIYSLPQGIYYYEVYIDDILMPKENSKPVRGKVVKQ